MGVHIHSSRELAVENLPALQDKVRLKGGRLLVYDEVLSLLFLCVRSYRVKWVASAEERRRAGLASSLVTLLLGWWAITGPYWSLTALLWNARGGFDATEALMRAHPGNASLLDYAATRALNESQASARGQARLICVTLIVALVGVMGYLVWSSGRR